MTLDRDVMFLDNWALQLYAIVYSGIYYKRDNFDFPIVNFPVLSRNIPASTAYSVCVSQLIRYATAWSIYQ